MKVLNGGELIKFVYDVRVDFEVILTLLKTNIKSILKIINSRNSLPKKPGTSTNMSNYLDVIGNANARPSCLNFALHKEMPFNETTPVFFRIHPLV